MTPDPKPAARIRDPDMIRRYRLEHTGEACEMCELRPGVDPHHIVFRSQGGGDIEGNLRWLCRICHDSVHGH